ncbi:hypothetical protein [Flavobacterium sp. ZB4R12]|uniref:hypothetical protein n=1 Tax=Flavobacterium sp. ZB4R12 TaxID=3398732 RepID=UPI003AAB8C72
MNRISILIMLFTSLTQAQNIEEVKSYQTLKTKLVNQVGLLTDSIKKIDLKINELESNIILKSIADSLLVAVSRQNAKLKKNPSPTAEPISIFQNPQKVLILDYREEYFGVCIGLQCGYMHEMWLEQNDKIRDFVKIKIAKKEELKRLTIERKIKREQKEEIKLEKIYVKKYGPTIYQKLKKGYYWIGMNQEMTTISLGSPNKINSTVGSWGTHEQWVYDTIYLYFENSKLTSYQN